MTSCREGGRRVQLTGQKDTGDSIDIWTIRLAAIYHAMCGCRFLDEGVRIATAQKQVQAKQKWSPRGATRTQCHHITHTLGRTNMRFPSRCRSHRHYDRRLRPGPVSSGLSTISQKPNTTRDSVTRKEELTSM